MMQTQVQCLCDYMKEPTGTGANPFFSWRVQGQTKGTQQVSYRLCIGLDAQLYDVFWDGGEILTSQSNGITYDGRRLQSGTRYFYTITVTDNTNTQYQSKTASFVTGVLDEQDWDSCWIGAPSMVKHSFLFRCNVMVDRPIKQAAAFVASPNYYHLSLNGKMCADVQLNNAKTEYTKTILYETYPITKQLHVGKNTLGLELGNGWYAMDLGERPVCKSEHLFALLLRIEYEDGMVEWKKSDRKSWYYTEQSPAIYNNVYHGEVYDARLELPGWNCPDYDVDFSSELWKKAFELDSPGGIIKSQTMEPIRIVEHRVPEKIIPLNDGSCMVDVGQNHAGWLCIKAHANTGTEMVLEYTELVHADYSPNPISLKRAKATDKYIFKGDTEEIYQPKFTYHGYRYVKISGLAYTPSVDDITDCVVHSDVERIGFFESSSNCLNQLYQNVVWSERSNLHGLPTDCPQRDERLGWLNDMTVRSECALYSYRLPQLYKKWVEDIKDGQGNQSGAICDTAPFYRMGQKPADPVSTSFLLTAWNVYCHYGDIIVLKDNFEAFERWVGYLKRHSEGGIVDFSHMGDWAAPTKATSATSIGAGAVSSITPTQLMATGYQYYNYCLLQKMALVLGKKQKAALYQNEAVEVKRAFQQKYYNSSLHQYAKNSQASNTFPLYLGLVSSNEKEAVINTLIYDIVETNKGHTTTGNLCSRYIIEVLLENGQEDLAFQLLTQTEYPGWGYMLEKGATTIWERWENVVDEGPNSGMASHNHPMNGAAALVLHKYFAGIKTKENSPGFSDLIVAPVIPQKLTWVKAKLDTLYGNVCCKWENDEKGFSMQVDIPFNTKADVEVPKQGRSNAQCAAKKISSSGDIDYIREEEGCFVYRISSGIYQFNVT